MEKQQYKNKLDKRPIDNKKAKEVNVKPTKEQIRKSGLVNPIEFNTGKNADE